jgi:hypothetical protein
LIAIDNPFSIYPIKEQFYMPNRIIRDWTNSTKIEQLTVHAERLFTRLIMKADDYGFFHANPKLLKPLLFPLLIDQIREADISRWTAECEKAGLIVLYEIESKQYLQIVDFNQRLRIKSAKFPAPQGFKFENDGHDDGHVSDRRRSHDGVKRSRREVEEKRSEFSSSAADTKNLPLTLDKRQSSFYSELTPYLQPYGKELLRAFYDYWSEPNKSKTKMRMELEKTWDLAKRLKRWQDNQVKFEGAGNNHHSSEKVNVR